MDTEPNFSRERVKQGHGEAGEVSPLGAIFYNMYDTSFQRDDEAQETFLATEWPSLSQDLVGS